jgi:hypothetical protein
MKIKLFLLKLIAGKDVVVINAKIKGSLYIDNTNGKHGFLINVEVDGTGSDLSGF